MGLCKQCKRDIPNDEDDSTGFCDLHCWTRWCAQPPVITIPAKAWLPSPSPWDAFENNVDLAIRITPSKTDALLVTMQIDRRGRPSTVFKAKKP